MTQQTKSTKPIPEEVQRLEDLLGARHQQNGLYRFDNRDEVQQREQQQQQQQQQRGDIYRITDETVNDKDVNDAFARALQPGDQIQNMPSPAEAAAARHALEKAQKQAEAVARLRNDLVGVSPSQDSFWETSSALDAARRVLMEHQKDALTAAALHGPSSPRRPPTLEQALESKSLGALQAVVHARDHGAIDLSSEDSRRLLDALLEATAVEDAAADEKVEAFKARQTAQMPVVPGEIPEPFSVAGAIAGASKSSLWGRALAERPQTKRLTDYDHHLKAHLEGIRDFQGYTPDAFQEAKSTHIKTLQQQHSSMLPSLNPRRWSLYPNTPSK